MTKRTPLLACSLLGLMPAILWVAVASTKTEGLEQEQSLEADRSRPGIRNVAFPTNASLAPQGDENQVSPQGEDTQDKPATKDSSRGSISAEEATVPDGEPTFVGREVCRECHQENFDLHKKHGHASTFFLTSETDLPEVFDGVTFDSGGDYGVYDYETDENRKLLAKLRGNKEVESLPLPFVLGSGHNAQTFLTLFTNAQGETEGIEHRVTCYADDRLDITVGHQDKKPTNAMEMYGDSIRGVTLTRCIHCHTTTATVRNGKIDDLISNVNCEKCHGPGSEHARLARGNPNPPPYSVGLETWDRESEIQLCGDCHRLPRSVTKQELREYPANLVRFQPIGMLRSKCSIESPGGLRCTTCHNPHATNHGSNPQDHIQNCIQCHDQSVDTHVICPVSATDNCIECHMPLVDQQQGIQFHDHWIRVHDE